jgi:hypothetical protein
LLNVVLSAVNIVLNAMLIPVYGAVDPPSRPWYPFASSPAVTLYLLRYRPGHLSPLGMGKLAAAAVRALVWARRSDQILLLIAAAAVVYVAAFVLGVRDVPGARLLRTARRRCSTPIDRSREDGVGAPTPDVVGRAGLLRTDSPHTNPMDKP